MIQLQVAEQARRAVNVALFKRLHLAELWRERRLWRSRNEGRGDRSGLAQYYRALGTECRLVRQED